MVIPASGADDPVPALLKGGNDCIFVRTIRDYTPLGRKHLIVWGSSRRRAYLVTVAVPSTGLRHSWRIGYRSRDSRLCPYGGDAILTDDPITRELRITAIREISAEEVDLLKSHFGEKKEADTQTPAPEETAGAEVEELDEPIPNPQ